MDILFYKPRTLIGKLIYLFTKAKYSHVGIRLDNYHILDINSGRSSEIRHIQASESDFDVVRINVSHDQKNALYSSIERYLGYEYDYLKAVGLTGDIDKYTCYELVNVILYDIGYLDEIYDIFLPEELIEILEVKDGNSRLD